MKELGIILIVIGLGVGYFAFDMDVSVSVSSIGSIAGDRVSNLSKMNDQQNLVIAAAAVCLMGTLFFVGGAIEKVLINPQVRELKSNRERNRLIPDNSDDSNLTTEQRDLKSKFERSEISVEDYQREWNKLS
jgi:hypothetical protein